MLAQLVGACIAGRSPFNVTAGSVSGEAGGASQTGFVTTSGDSPNVTPSGGTSPYTYAWTKQTDADGAAFSINSSVTQNPVWSGTRDDAHVDNTETWKVTVTDDNGRETSITISVTLTWTEII